MTVASTLKVEKDDTKQNVKGIGEQKRDKFISKLFPIDDSSDSEPENGDSSLSYAQKVTTKRVPQKRSKILAPSQRVQIAKHSDLKKEYKFKKIRLESPDEGEEAIEISSDEDLERSMWEMELPSIEASNSE